MKQHPRSPTSMIDHLTCHPEAASHLDERLLQLIEEHDNTFQCSTTLINALTGKFSFTDRFGRTPACLAASLGKKKLAQGIIRLGGGNRVLDVRQMSAEDYLALPDDHFSSRSEENQAIETIRIADRIQHRHPTPKIVRQPAPSPDKTDKGSSDT